MGSWFDSQVYQRRRSNPWTTPNLLSFAHDVLMNYFPDREDRDSGIVLTINSRPDVASRLWYTLSWLAADGQRFGVSSQEYDLLMWRAAVAEQNAREERNGKDGAFVVSVLDTREPGDPVFDRRVKAHMNAVERSSENNVCYEVWDKSSGDTLVLVRNGQSFS